MNDSYRYYDLNADTFVKQIIGADMSERYSRFLAHVPPCGLILDASCGSGRDSRYFLERGYWVASFDASQEMAQKRSALINRKVLMLHL